MRLQIIGGIKRWGTLKLRKTTMVVANYWKFKFLSPNSENAVYKPLSDSRQNIRFEFDYMGG